jgi:DUF4097 and DUF4098 domain-containing protein YvlB
MKALILGFCVIGLGCVLALRGVHANLMHTVTNTVSNDDSLSDNCSDHLHNHGWRYRSVVRDEETRSLQNQPLDIHAEQNGGIAITTWDKPDFSVKLCKEVASDSDDQGRKILSETKLSVDGGKVSVSAPDRDDEYNLNTLLLIKAPRDAQVRMKVTNGGISVREFTGTAEAQAQNGGIALKHSSGKLELHAQNGGISIVDCGGDVNAEVENGGLSIVLPDQWQGKGLEAHTQNGGLSISVPRNLTSGLEVIASNYVSIVCKSDACEKGQRSWDDEHRILRLGSGTTQIRATTVNGGIVITDREHSRDTI